MSNVAGSAPAPGTTVAGYQIEALIGRVGMGAVYHASEEGPGRKVALKVIASELAQDERFRERFLRESRIAASLDHPHGGPRVLSGWLAVRVHAELGGLVARGAALAAAIAVSLLAVAGARPLA